MDIDLLGPQLYPDDYTRVNIFGGTRIAPAAGSDVRITVPNGVLWRVVALVGTLTASGNAANRNVGFVVLNQDAQVVYQYNLTSALTAGQVGNFTFSEDCSTVPTAIATTNHLLMPKPRALIPAGWTFGTSTLNIDGSDAWSAVAAWVQEWLPPAGE